VALDPFNVRRGVGVLTNARRALLPLPLVDRRARMPDGVLPPFEAHPAPGLEGKRIGVACGAGGGGAVGIIGMVRAFEEAGLRPDAISVCSTSVLWGAMWVAGMTAEQVADRSLSWSPEYELGVQWLGVPRLATAALRGFSGLPKGAALEQLFDRHVWRMSAGATEIPLHTFAWDLDRRRPEQLGSETTPDLTLGELARIAVAQPRHGEAVRIEGRFYADGGHADPSLDRPLAVVDHVFGPELEGGRGHAFYDLFLDRRGWPELIRRGYDATVEALAPFRAPTGRRRSASPS